MQNLSLPVSLKNKIENHPKLLSHNLNYMINKSGGEIRALCRGNNIIGFNNPGYTIISNDQVLKSLENVFGDNLLIDKYSIESSGKLNINISNDDKVEKFKAAKDDYFQAGVHLVNSPFTNEQTAIEGYLLRLVCTNGSIDNDVVYKAPRRVGDDSNSWLRSSIKEGIRSAGKLFKGIKKLQSKEIKGDHVTFMSNLFEQLEIPEDMQNKILRRVGNKGIDNMYDVFNHLTYVASHDKEIRSDATLRNKLMRLSSHYVHHIDAVCGSCSRPSFV